MSQSERMLGRTLIRWASALVGRAPAAFLPTLAAVAIAACEPIPYGGNCPCASGYTCCNNRCISQSQRCERPISDSSATTQPYADASAGSEATPSDGADVGDVGGANGIDGAPVPEQDTVSREDIPLIDDADPVGDATSERDDAPGESVSPDGGMDIDGSLAGRDGNGAGGGGASGGNRDSGGASGSGAGPSSGSSVATGLHHTCAIRAGGTVMCWGANDLGQLGDGLSAPAAVNRPAPVGVLELTGAKALCAGNQHSCALLAGGTVMCWGDNSAGQLGNTAAGSYQSKPIEVSGLSSVTAMRASFDQTCALIADGTVKCWGENNDGQLGDGTMVRRPTPVLVAGLRDATELSVGTNHACAVVAGGSVLCWGRNDLGQLGDGTYTNRLAGGAVLSLSGARAVSAGDSRTCALLSGGTVSCWGSGAGRDPDGTAAVSKLPVAVTGLTGVTAVSAGGLHTCAILGDGTAKCWGSNWSGEIGSGSDRHEELEPATVSGLGNVTALGAASSHTCAADREGRVWCWGDNAYGQLGNPAVAKRALPVAVSGLTGIVSLGSGAFHNCALLNDGIVSGTVKCWGNNGYGELGDGTLVTRLTPTATSGLPPGVTSLAMGAGHTCAIVTDGRLVCWGDNTYGQLGIGSLGGTFRTPASVSGLTGVTAVTLGRFHTCALLASGTAKCWGENAEGQLGDGTAGLSAGKSAPVAVSGLDHAVALKAGSAHTCALLVNGTVHCWGNNYSGQLGMSEGYESTESTFPTPVPVSDLGEATAIALGAYHTCALLKDRTVQCWGNNDSGQLGNGDKWNRSSPTMVLDLADVTAITAGPRHTCALLAAGTVKCWGDDQGGEIGDGVFGMYIQRTTPVATLGLTGVQALAAGDCHTCALLSDRTAKCWGDNGTGQIGDGTMSESRIPVAVVF